MLSINGLHCLDHLSVSSFENKVVTEHEQYYLDLAASFHEVFEEIYEDLFKNAYNKVGVKDFIFVGGVAQNCVLASRLEKLASVENLHIPLDRMRTIVKVKEEFQMSVRFGLHIDGTTRLQVVRKENNELLYNILSLEKKREGGSCLINTSFNDSGLPLIQSVVDALYFFKEKPLGPMVIDNLLISRSQ